MCETLELDDIRVWTHFVPDEYTCVADCDTRITSMIPPEVDGVFMFYCVSEYKYEMCEHKEGELTEDLCIYMN